jgi:plastocyanin
MRKALLAALLALLVPAGASAAAIPVAIPGFSFQPKRVVALVGDTLTWTNASGQTHTVTADDDSFDSGALEPGQSFAHTFAEQGAFTYYCTIHRFMTGEVDVFAIALSGPAAAVRPHGSATLTGAAPAGTASVAIEQAAPGGSFEALATVVPAPDGTFAVAVSPALPTRYRAVAGALASPAVLVSVAARVELVPLRGAGPSVSLLVRTRPAQAGAPVVLERYARERFAWVRVTRARLGRGGNATLELRPRRAVRVRVRLLRGIDGYGPATSPPVLVRPPSQARARSG